MFICFFTYLSIFNYYCYVHLWRSHLLNNYAPDYDPLIDGTAPQSCICRWRSCLNFYYHCTRAPGWHSGWALAVALVVARNGVNKFCATKFISCVPCNMFVRMSEMHVYSIALTRKREIERSMVADQCSAAFRGRSNMSVQIISAARDNMKLN